MNTTNDQAEIPEVTIPEALIAVRARILASLNFPTLFQEYSKFFNALKHYYQDPDKPIHEII